MRTATRGPRTSTCSPDHDAPWRMRLSHQRLPNGPGTLRVQAVLTDGRLHRTAASVQVSSSQPLPPADQPFVPRSAAPARTGGSGWPSSATASTARPRAWPSRRRSPPSTRTSSPTSATSTTTARRRVRHLVRRPRRLRPVRWPSPTRDRQPRVHGPTARRPYFAYWGEVPHYYSYDVGGWHVVVLDSTTEFAEPGRANWPGSAQYDWLAADLGRPPGTLHDRVHAPPALQQRRRCQPGRPGTRSGSCSSTANVTMVLAGHAHTYERWTPMDRHGAAAPGGLTAVRRRHRRPGDPQPEAAPSPRVAAQTSPAPGRCGSTSGRDDAAFAFAVDRRHVHRLRHDAVPAPRSLRRTRPRPRCPRGVAARARVPDGGGPCPGPRPPTPWASPATPCAAAASRSRRCRRPRRPTGTARWLPSAGTPGPSRPSTPPATGLGQSAGATATTPYSDAAAARLLAALRRAPETGPRVHRRASPAGRTPTATAAARRRSPRRRGSATAAGRAQLRAHGWPLALAVRREVPDPERPAGRRPPRAARARRGESGAHGLATAPAPAARQRPRLPRDPGGGHASAARARPAGSRRTGCRGRRTGAPTSPTGSP